MAESIRFQHFEVPRREDGSLYELGRGAMGITYKAFDTNLRCFVALKVINAAYLENDVARQRFLREARAAAALRHPNVATVFHLGQEGDDCFYAMEFVDGETVESLMKREGAIPAAIALKIVLQVARALGAAQKQNLVHRDIKPANLMIVREDDSEFTVKVIDFGLAKNSSGAAEDTAALTMAGFLGTPHFASPEQLEERDLDVRSDIYSLGVTLYYMLAGHAPFSGSLAQVMSQHLHRDPPLDALSDQPAPVLDLLRHMLAKDAGARPQTPADLRREIETCLKCDLAVPSKKIAVADENFETQAMDIGASVSLELAPNVVLADRYRIINEVTAADHGRVFHAKSLETSASVAILVLDASLLRTGEAYTQMEEQIVRLQKLDAPALQKILSFERFAHLSFLVLEWIEGPTLLDLMRKRRALPLTEALPLLRGLASGFEALQTASLPCPDISAHEITLVGGDVNRPVVEWPAFTIKFNALSPAFSSVATPESTLVMSAFLVLQESGAFTSNKAGASIYTLATLAYEMLGGVRSGVARSTPVPIPGLSEAGNAALRRALDPAQSFPSISDFLNALESAAPSKLGIPAIQSARQVSPPLLPEKKSRKLVFFIVPTVIAFIIAGGFFVTHKATPPVVSPTPTPVADVTPAPTATPDLLTVELDKARENLPSDPAGSLEKFLEISKAHPNQPDVESAIETSLQELRARLKTSAFTPEQVAALRQPLDNAAAMNIPKAQILLALLLSNGFGNSKPDLPGAAQWFQRAANLGDEEAMFCLGECYSNGKGVPRDLSLAVKFLQAAVDKNEPKAMGLLGALYMNGGEGIEKNKKAAVKLFRDGTQKNDPRCMRFYGMCLLSGIPEILESNPSHALKLFSSAKNLGDLDAQGNLSALYNDGGEGVKKDEKTALALARDGAQKNNPFCMRLYAMYLMNGTDGIAVNQDEARDWYVKAAQAGESIAQEWCRNNSVPFDTKPPTP